MMPADRIAELGVAARDIAMIPDPKLRHEGGFWLHAELARLDDGYVMTKDERLDFMAVLKVMFDAIFRDAKEDGPKPGGLWTPE